nr:YdbH domain-containing protein [uncultured Pseudodesulfovibrio sp.]
MAASLWKKMAKRSLLLVPWLLALVLAVGWMLTVWTPKYLEELIPRLAADMGVELTEFRINHAGLFSADIGPVHIGNGVRTLKLSNVHVTYTPASLKRKRIDTVLLDGLSLTCSFENGKFTLPLLDLLPKSQDNSTSDSAIPDIPFDELLIQNSILCCTIDGKPLSIPFEATITPGETVQFDLRLRPRDQTISISGKLGPTLNDLLFTANTDTFRLGPFNDFLPVPITGRMDLGLTGVMNLSQPDAMTADFTLSMQKADFSSLGVQLADGAVISMKGGLENKEISFSMLPVSVVEPFPVTGDIRSGRISTDSLFAQFTLVGAGVEMGGRLEADKIPDRTDSMWNVAFTAANPDNLVVDTNGRVIHLAGFIFSLQGTAGPDSADMILNCATNSAGLGNTTVRSGKMRLTLPLAWPAPDHHTQGKMSLSNVRMDEHTLGNVSARVRQQGTDVAYNGTLFTKLLPDLRIPFSGASSMISNRTSLNFGIKKYTLPNNFSPAKLVPALKDITISGALDMDGAITMDKEGIRSRLGAFFTNGHMAVSGGTTSISGIRLSFETPDLLSMRSSPAQTLFFDAIQAGGIAIRNGKIMYQLEPEGVVLVEQAGFDWAGGHVSSRAFRIVPGSKEYEVTMFCSELKLSEILSQLGLAEAQGEAAMSGELPVTLKNGKISFNSGFLHSTPGQGGTIRVQAMEDLVASIPEGTPQRGQIELAQAAVRDFEYKWVRIKADTVGEDLLVRLSVDGKPAGTLPFIYKREFGGFMRVTGDVKGSNFQGLRLDVNFSVPLDRILLYKDIVNMIE